MKRVSAVLVAGVLAVPAVAFAQQVVPSAPAAVVTYPVPAPQAGVSYWCGNPQGWYPNVQVCSVGWTAATQPPVVTAAPGNTVVVPSPAPAYVVVTRPYVHPMYESPASAVYYVGPYRNAPYQSGIAP